MNLETRHLIHQHAEAVREHERLAIQRQRSHDQYLGLLAKESEAKKKVDKAADILLREFDRMVDALVSASPKEE